MPAKVSSSTSAVLALLQETTLKRLSRAALLYNQRPDYALSGVAC